MQVMNAEGVVQGIWDWSEKAFGEGEGEGLVGAERRRDN